MWGAKEEGLVKEREVPEVNVPKSSGTTGHPLPVTPSSRLVWGSAKGKGEGE